MPRWFKPLVAALLVIYMVMQVLSLSIREKKTLKPVERFIVSLSTPLQTALWEMVSGIGDVWKHYIALTQTSRQNDRLSAEISGLKREMIEIEEAKRENKRLRDLLDLKMKEGFHLVAAERIASGVSPFEQTMRLRVEKIEEITPGLPVIHSGGIVGQVVEVSRSSCDVLLLTDLNSAIDGVDQRSRARGILKGAAGSELKFEYLSTKDDVQVGDQIVTSGLDGIYPKGIPIGVVTRVDNSGKSLFLSAKVRPHVDINKIEEVGILLR